ncbi:hypothetical protein PanWU01x14_068070 [Parasponia andersonii]|uniref:Uncharacterized protein n=1 Tax=Parasponia andersonii TaxID=3476 RepID=A0A2P5DF86_PARAD|nr:hypothetical protein PanWU01x14_068070 [Parasponia andersonii]
MASWGMALLLLISECILLRNPERLHGHFVSSITLAASLSLSSLPSPSLSSFSKAYASISSGYLASIFALNRIGYSFLGFYAKKDPADFFVPAKELNFQHYLNFVNKARQHWNWFWTS